LGLRSWYAIIVSYQFMSAQASRPWREVEVGNADMTRRYGGDHVTRRRAACDPVPPMIVGIGQRRDSIGAFDAPSSPRRAVLGVHGSSRRCTHVGTGWRRARDVPGITGISRYDMDHWGQYCATMV
jgi:hypothetical protein